MAKAKPKGKQLSLDDLRKLKPLADLMPKGYAQGVPECQAIDPYAPGDWFCWLPGPVDGRQVPVFCSAWFDARKDGAALLGCAPEDILVSRYGR